jgi:hypothetical protein
MIRRLTLALLLLLALGIATTIQAACRWTWDCTRGYPCRQVPVCDSAIDLPSVPPAQISPISPPSIAPIPAPVVPPIGTTQCRQAYLCDARGRCAWRTVCQ